MIEHFLYPYFASGACIGWMLGLTIDDVKVTYSGPATFVIIYFLILVPFFSFYLFKSFGKFAGWLPLVLWIAPGLVSIGAPEFMHGLFPVVRPAGWWSLVVTGKGPSLAIGYAIFAYTFPICMMGLEVPKLGKRSRLRFDAVLAFVSAISIGVIADRTDIVVDSHDERIVTALSILDDQLSFAKSVCLQRTGAPPDGDFVPTGDFCRWINYVSGREHITLQQSQRVRLENGFTDFDGSLLVPKINRDDLLREIQEYNHYVCLKRRVDFDCDAMRLSLRRISGLKIDEIVALTPEKIMNFVRGEWDSLDGIVPNFYQRHFPSPTKETYAILLLALACTLKAAFAVRENYRDDNGLPKLATDKTKIAKGGEVPEAKSSGKTSGAAVARDKNLRRLLSKVARVRGRFSRHR